MVNRLMKASDRVLSDVIMRQDSALRRDGFEADWIRTNDNGTKYAEKVAKTGKGHNVKVRTYLSKTNDTVSYARTFYGENLDKMSENYFIVCNTQGGRKVYYKPVKQDRVKNEEVESPVEDVIAEELDPATDPI